MSEQHLRQALEDLAAQAADREDLVAVAERRFRRGRRWRAVLAGVAAAAVVVAGVAFVPPMVGVQGPLPIGSGMENPPFPTSHANYGMMAYRGAGMLVLVDDCVYLTAPSGKGALTAVIFPDSAKWNPATQQITLDGTTVTVGKDLVASGGGGVDASFADHIPAACHYDKTDPDAFWAVAGISRVPVAKRTPGESRPFAISHYHGEVADRIPSAKLVLDGGCAYLDTPKGSQTPLMFPDQTTWDPTTQQISLYKDTVSIGDQVALLGGYVKASAAVYIPDGCHYDRTSDKSFLLVYAIDRWR